MRVETSTPRPAEQPKRAFPALYTDRADRIILFATPYTGMILRRKDGPQPFKFLAEINSLTLNTPVDTLSEFRRFDGVVTLSNT